MPGRSESPNPPEAEPRLAARLRRLESADAGAFEGLARSLDPRIPKASLKSGWATRGWVGALVLLLPLCGIAESVIR